MSSRPVIPISHKWDLRFLDLATTVASWSKDPSTKAGAVIVRTDRTIVAVGYNGFSRHSPDTPALYENREEKYSRIIHCEINALLSAKQDISLCTLYTWPFMPCDRCCVQMIQAGISRIVAPVASNRHWHRWNESFEKTRRYCEEAGVRLDEIPGLWIDNQKSSDPVTNDTFPIWRSV